MEVRNCKGCGRLFNFLGGLPLCPECKKELEDKFGAAKEYVRENPGCTIQMVAETVDVPPQQIRQWIREERLEFSQDSPVTIECEACGARIRTGRYCDACKKSMQMGFSNAIRKPAPTMQSTRRERDGNKMRFLDN